MDGSLALHWTTAASISTSWTFTGIGRSQGYVNENILRDIEEFFKPGAYITQLKATERHHWRLFIRSHVVSSGATKGFTLLFSYM